MNFLKMFLYCVLATSPLQAAVYDVENMKIPDEMASSELVNWKMLTTEEGAPWRGIQQIATEMATCSGTLIDTGRGDTEKAYFLTNGHCSHIDATLIKPTEVFTNVNTISAFTANYYVDNKVGAVSYKGSRLVYLTLNSTDIAIYELDHTIGYMKERGFNFFKLSKKKPKPGTKVINVGLPLDHMTEETTYLHYSECTLGENVQLMENEWVWPYSVRHNCSAVGGMSGSPLINKKTLEIVALVNTVVEDVTTGEPDCSLGRPCEDPAYPKVYPQYNYGQSVERLSQCFDKTGAFNLYSKSCTLPKPQ